MVGESIMRTTIALSSRLIFQSGNIYITTYNMSMTKKRRVQFVEPEVNKLLIYNVNDEPNKIVPIVPPLSKPLHLLRSILCTRDVKKPDKPMTVTMSAQSTSSGRSQLSKQHRLTSSCTEEKGNSNTLSSSHMWQDEPFSYSQSNDVDFDHEQEGVCQQRQRYPTFVNYTPEYVQEQRSMIPYSANYDRDGWQSMSFSQEIPFNELSIENNSLLQPHHQMYVNPAMIKTSRFQPYSDPHMPYRKFEYPKMSYNRVVELTNDLDLNDRDEDPHTFYRRRVYDDYRPRQHQQPRQQVQQYRCHDNDVDNVLYDVQNVSRKERKEEKSVMDHNSRIDNVKRNEEETVSDTSRITSRRHNHYYDDDNDRNRKVENEENDALWDSEQKAVVPAASDNKYTGDVRYVVHHKADGTEQVMVHRPGKKPLSVKQWENVLRLREIQAARLRAKRLEQSVRRYENNSNNSNNERRDDNVQTKDQFNQVDQFEQFERGKNTTTVRSSVTPHTMSRPVSSSVVVARDDQSCYMQPSAPLDTTSDGNERRSIRRVKQTCERNNDKLARLLAEFC